MNKDLISRQAAIDAIFSEPLYESGMKKRDADAVAHAIYEKIKSLPSVERRGRWIEDGCIIKCNLCGELRRFPHWTTCPNCGARMDKMDENFIRIELKKRTLEEKQAWHEGYNYGLADGKRNENTTLIFKSKCRMGVEQYRLTISDLERQADRGIILLHPEIEFVQAVGNNPEVRLEYDDKPEE